MSGLSTPTLDEGLKSEEEAASAVPGMVARTGAELAASESESGAAAAVVVGVTGPAGEAGAQAGAVVAVAGTSADGADGAGAAGELQGGVVVSAATVTGRDTSSGVQVSVQGPLQISEDAGFAVARYQRGEPLPAKDSLVKLYVTEARLAALWTDIDKVEAEVTATPKLSRKIAEELLDRLAAARNLLLNSRASYEEALRELAEVRYLLGRIQQSGAAQQPGSIVLYLIFVLALIVAGFVTAPRFGLLLGNPVEMAGVDPGTLWYTILWGGIGGISAGLYSLGRHVEDYDPQHAQWYYLSPILGLIFGPLIALVAQLGLPAFFTFASSQAANMEVNSVVLYMLAWVVGFQQNLLLRLINSILKRLSPAEPEEQRAAPPPRR